MTDVLITEFMDRAAIERLSARFRIHYDPDLPDKPDVLAQLVPEARALIVRNRTQVRGKILNLAENLSCIGRLGVGLDNIDTADCEARGIAVYPATGANDQAVAEYVIAATMILMRRAYHARGLVEDGSWPRETLIGGEVAGKTLGLIGFGAIAREVAHRAGALGMDVVAHDPFLAGDDPAWELAKPVSLNDLLRQSDAVSLHVPLIEATRHLIGPDQVSLMREGAILINAARGGVVDETALIVDLRDGSLGGAALDVFETEPLTATAGGRFAGIDNLILTPHIAGLTRESNSRVSALVAGRVTAHLEELA
ncbi:MAG: hydroxyacid dehydrogenase [Paracoccaceae bacterium]|nr:hydroxyacid dehydrogenase [Paracoccaceae bacterium]